MDCGVDRVKADRKMEKETRIRIFYFMARKFVAIRNALNRLCYRAIARKSHEICM